MPAAKQPRPRNAPARDDKSPPAVSPTKDKQVCQSAMLQQATKGSVTMDSYVESFNDKGYAILDGYLTGTEVSEVLHQIEEIHDVALKKLGLDPSAYASLDEKYDFLRDNHPEVKSKCYDMSGKLDAVTRALSKDSLLKFGKAVFDSPLVMQNFQIRILDSVNERLYPLHQEIGLISTLNFTMWIGLTDVRTGNGGLTCIPGSHKRGELRHYYTEGEKNYRIVEEDQIDESEVIEVCTKAGDAVVFQPLLVHGSAKNESSLNRWTLIGRFNGLADLPLVPA
jgi:hypothetical protein